MHSIRIFRNKFLPRARAACNLGLSRLIEVAQCGSERIGGIELGKQVLGRDVEDAPQHILHLLLGGGTVAGYGHLDFSRLILGYGYVAAYRGGHGHTLGAAKLEHRLHVFAEERGLDCHLVGEILLDYARDTVEYVAKPQIVTVKLVKLYDTHRYHGRLGALDAEDSEAHNIGARVYTYYNTVPLGK